MKILTITFTILFFQGLYCIRMPQYSNPIKRLNVPNKQFLSLLASVSHEERERYEKDECVYVFRVKKAADCYNLKLSILYKKNFSWYLIDKEDYLIGYFEYKNRIVLVFGDNTKFFQASRDTKHFDFLAVPEKANQEDTTGIVKPPIIFEPHVWIYQIKKNKFVLVKDGQFKLLE